MTRPHNESYAKLWSRFRRETAQFTDANEVLERAAELVVDWGINREAMRDILSTGVQRGELEARILDLWNEIYCISDYEAIVAHLTHTPDCSEAPSRQPSIGAARAEPQSAGFYDHNHPEFPRFIGRERELALLDKRIAESDCCFLTGPPYSGKTALLRQVEELQGSGKHTAAGTLIRCCLFFDCRIQFGPLSDDQAENFFRSLWRRILAAFPQGSHLDTLNELLRSPLEVWVMSELFEQLDRQHRRVVVLLDNLDALYGDSRLGKLDFLVPLFALARTKRGLVLITASRLFLAEMNRWKQMHQDTFLSFFYQQGEVFLHPLSPEEASQFLKHTLLPPTWFPVLATLAGRHPFFLQVAATVVKDVLERRDDTECTEEALALVRKLTLERLSVYCTEQWSYLSAEDKEALLALRSSALATSDEERSAWYAEQWERLAVRGIVECRPPASPRYRISAEIFAQWLAQNQPEERPLGGVSQPRALQYVLCLHAPADRMGFQTLRHHLVWLDRVAQMSLKSLDDVPPGLPQRDAGLQLLQEAAIVVVLLSADLLSDAWLTELVNRSVTLQKKDAVQLLPVYYRPVDLVPHGLDGLVLLPRDRKPISTWTNSDEAWLEIAESLRQVISA